MATKIPFIDLYSINDDVEINIIEEIFNDYSIVFMVKTACVEARLVCDKVIAVEEDQLKEAKRLLIKAINNGVITGVGGFNV
ncbi:MAG: hypothetical protein KAS88_05290 [Deltaproteobacteria bacterium]|nr:hypothetical protein [Deltaproteobacteria bacterium]